MDTRRSLRAGSLSSRAHADAIELRIVPDQEVMSVLDAKSFCPECRGHDRNPLGERFEDLDACAAAEENRHHDDVRSGQFDPDVRNVPDDDNRRGVVQVGQVRCHRTDGRIPTSGTCSRRSGPISRTRNRAACTLGAYRRLPGNVTVGGERDLCTAHGMLHPRIRIRDHRGTGDAGSDEPTSIEFAAHHQALRAALGTTMESAPPTHFFLGERRRPRPPKATDESGSCADRGMLGPRQNLLVLEIIEIEDRVGS